MCCLPSWREIPELKVTELELKFILASSHLFILYFFHSVSTMCLYQTWTCLGFQHSVIIQYNFLVVQLEIWDKRPFQTEMSIMAGSISFPLMKYLRMIKHEIDTISCFLCTNVSLPPCLISSMFRHAGGICSFLWVVSCHKVSRQLIVGWLCPRN